MPRNEVLERMAKKLSKHIADSFCSKKEWEETSANYKTTCYSVALELLGIVEYYTELIDDSCFDGEPPANEAYEITQHLSQAFQMAREARERREKGSNDSPNPGSEAGR